MVDFHNILDLKQMWEFAQQVGEKQLSLREQLLDKFSFHFDLELEMGLKEVPAFLRLACKNKSTSERPFDASAFS